MLCLNSKYCLNRSQCVLGFCIYPNEYYLDQQYDIRSNSLTLPMIGAILHDYPSLRPIYISIFIFLALIGFINNIFSLMTSIRYRIRYTTSGVYLIIYSICSLILMILILTNIITAIYYNEYLFRLWACHGYPYLSLVMVYNSILISAVMAIECVLNECFNYDIPRARKRPLLISLLLFLIVSILNLDKIFARRLITNQSGDFYCMYEKHSYQCWSTILFFIFIILPCSIHLICIVCILSTRKKENCIPRIFRYQHYIIPSFFISSCIFLSGSCLYLFHFYLINSKRYLLRLHIGFIFLLYTPQILTYMIYVIPNEFYVKEFYQIWFYRKLCCCFYNKKRHIQEFAVIHRLWQRRTSLETIKTISTLDDTCVDSEFYKKN